MNKEMLLKMSEWISKHDDEEVRACDSSLNQPKNCFSSFIS